MEKVAKCEGVRNGLLDPEAFNPTNGSGDKGIFQISTLYHYDTYTSLGFTDMYDVEQNVAYARLLYDSQGLQPWSASRLCWSR
jgi:hypothetical protein